MKAVTSKNESKEGPQHTKEKMQTPQKEKPLQYEEEYTSDLEFDYTKETGGVKPREEKQLTDEQFILQCAIEMPTEAGNPSANPRQEAPNTKPQ